MVKGFILAAGFSERLRPLTDKMPKALIPVLNLPSICYALFLLKEAGINEIVCNLHYRANDIIRFLRLNDYFGLNISFSIEEEILGTGGGLKQCEKWLGNEEFVLINSDIILDIQLRDVINFHKQSSSSATLVLYQTKHVRQIGSIGIKNDYVVDFNNIRNTGVDSNYIYTGVAVLSSVIFRYLKNTFSSIVHTGYVTLVEHQSIGYYEHQGFWQDVGTVEMYWNANIRMMKDILNLGERISRVMGLGPHVLSPLAEIDENAVLSHSVVGKNVRIGGNVHIENSVVLPDSVIDRSRNIGHSVVYRGGVIQVDNQFQ